MASEQVNPQQLAMFRPAGDLVDSMRRGDLQSGDSVYRNETVDEVEQSKLVTARRPYTGPGGNHGSGVRDYIETTGKVPFGEDPYTGQPMTPLIDVSSRHPQGTLLDGHHRIFSANDVDPRIEVPLQYDGTKDQLRGL